MAYIKVGSNESLDSALKRFKAKCSKENLIGSLRAKEAYRKPSDVRREKKREKLANIKKYNARRQRYDRHY